MFFLRESEATAACFFCAKAKRQQHDGFLETSVSDVSLTLQKYLLK
ncbi:hypothetical protein [Lysinibacillus sp. TE18511]